MGRWGGLGARSHSSRASEDCGIHAVICPERSFDGSDICAAAKLPPLLPSPTQLAAFAALSVAAVAVAGGADAGAAWVLGVGRRRPTGGIPLIAACTAA